MIFKKGDKVGYTRAFCQSSGCELTDEIWFRKGIIESQKGLFAQVLWDENTSSTMVNINNIAKVGSAAFAHSEAKGWIGYAPYQKSPWKKL